MDEDLKPQQGKEGFDHDEELMDRRSFLVGLRKWSKIVIGSALVRGALLNSGSEVEAGG
ncbi:MAG: hypothetical protein HQK57_13370, partial [Deltaproteobacteria bacterium]|nr:hypothetical protein [Deltaproteobacteria bacterium]